MIADNDEMAECIICRDEYLLEDVLDGVCADCRDSHDLEDLLDIALGIKEPEVDDDQT